MLRKISLEKYVMKYILLILPLYVYGTYKNGVLLYQKDLISFFNIFKLEYLLFINLVIYVLLLLIFKKKVKFDLVFLSLFIIPLFVPFSVNWIGYIILVSLYGLASLLLYKDNNFPYLTLLLFLLGACFGDFLNPAEKANIYAFSSLDLLFGRCTGALGSTSIILGLGVVVALSLMNFYKLSITISALFGYIVMLLLLHEPLFIIHGTAIMSILLLAPYPSFSPIGFKAKLIYGVIVGIISALCTKYINYYYGVFLAIFICQLGVEIICIMKRKMI